MHHTIIEFGFIIIRSYALMLSIAFLLGTILAIKRARKYGIQSYEIITLANVIILASIVGSRILYVLENLNDFFHTPKTILFIWQGGFSYHGGLFLAFLGALWWINKVNISFYRLLDIVAPSIALGFFLVRIGCFLNGCCFGNPTEMAWGVIFPLNSPAGSQYGGVEIHPTQLYSSISGLLSFFILLALEKKLDLRDREGFLFCIVIALSATWRFIIEYYRYHEVQTQVVPWLTNDQGICIVLFLFSIYYAKKIWERKHLQFDYLQVLR